MLSLPSDHDPSAAFHTNVIGTFNVMEAARLLDVEKVIFSSSIATYASGITEETIDDLTPQRPQFFYGACKLFGEHTGLFYKRKYGIDYRGIRYPVIVGPGVRSPGAAQYSSWVIEESAKGKPFSVWVEPEQRASLVYFKDAARATVALADAPADSIEMANYLISGTSPTAADLVDVVRRKVPGAEIDFVVNEEIQAILNDVLRPIDDRFARHEWGWEPTYDLEQMVAGRLDPDELSGSRRREAGREGGGRRPDGQLSVQPVHPLLAGQMDRRARPTRHRPLEQRPA